MLDKESIYRKTSRGTEALAVRQGGLTPRQRSLLILVDGRRNGKELSTLGAACGDVAELMQALLAEGYVEVSVPAPAPAEARKPGAGADTGTGTLTLAQARTQAVRRLTDMLGPGATDLCLRLEAARSVQEFRATLRRTESTLRQIVGNQRAADFVSELEDKLGAA